MLENTAPDIILNMLGTDFIVILTEISPYGWDRDRILFEVKTGCKDFSGSCGEIYLEKCFQDLGYFPKERLENAKIRKSLAILVDPTISEEEQFEAAKKIRSVIIQASK